MSREWMHVGVLLYSVLLVVQGADVDGSWNAWMQWTTCSVTCGEGYHVRSRICDNPEPTGKGNNCSGLDYDTKPCNMSHCPVDGEWGNWEAWRGCTVTCDTGVTYRTRKCDSPEPAYNGSDCVGARQTFDKCFIRHCPRNGGWTNWSDFGECSQTCGYDVYRTRQRNCSNPAPAYGGDNCTGDELEIGVCEYVDCKDGTWEEWASWTDCAQTCGHSYKFRFRNCTFSDNNGTCIGNEFGSDRCFTHCPVNGGWSQWGNWSECSATCEKGFSTRMRLCNYPVPQYGGEQCNGTANQTKACTVATPCPIDGQWTDWEGWSACDATCDGGYHVRIRRCTNPPPLYDGKPCPGLDIEAESCNLNHCQINGNWSDWFTWSECSTSCGTGTRSRFRTCTNPRPQYGGDYCVGSLEESVSCTISPDLTNCTIDGGWGSWGSWGSCAITCGDGVITRSRNCSNPVPHGEGKYCVGDKQDTTACSADTPCPINGGWTEWRSWFPCSVTCGTGTQTRIRTCSNPKPHYGGEYCIGEVDDNKNCTAAGACAGDTALIG